MSNTMLALAGCTAVPVVTSLLWSSLRTSLLAKETGVFDCDYAGKARTDKAKIPGTVVICGGSVGGLFTARLMHDHFERVIIVEAESWLDTEDARRVDSWNQENARGRIMQYSSIHGNQPILYKAMNNMYPGLDAECAASDIGVAPSDFKASFFGHPLKAPYAAYGGTLPKTVWASRRGVETLTRRLTLDSTAYPNIEQIIGTITGYVADEKHPQRLSKVSIRTKAGESLDIDAAFVIDCTGSTQAGIKWIQRAGFDKDDFTGIRETFHQKMHYVTYTFTISKEFAAKLPVPGGFDNIGGGIIIYYPDTSRDNRYAAAVKAEGRTMYVCCGSWGEDSLPRTFDGVRAHLESIAVDSNASDWFFDVIDMLVESGEQPIISPIHVGPSYYTHFERAKNLPTNWVAIGDSVSRLNPLYGQGTSKAMLGALALNTILHKNRYLADIPRNITTEFFAALAAKTEPLWTNAKISDYAHQTTEPAAGESLENGSFLRWYSRQLQVLGQTDAYIGHLLWKSLSMMDIASIDLLHPRVLFKVLWQALTSK